MDRRTVAGRALLLLLLTVFLAGCGQDGDDGEAYIAYSWLDEEPVTFLSFDAYAATREFAFQEEYRGVTADPAFPDPDDIPNGRYRIATEGTWGMAYTLAGGDGFWAVYEIYIEKGEPAQLFSDGRDGSDIYFEIFCGPDGPELFIRDQPVTVETARAGAARHGGLVASLGANIPGSTQVYRDNRVSVTFTYGPLGDGFAGD